MLKNETGNTYGTWTVVRSGGKNEWGARLWECRCKCGEKKTINVYMLRKGQPRCHKCTLYGQLIDETGNIYGKLRVIEPVRIMKEKRTVWRCQCECGNEVIAGGSSLRRGKPKQCKNCADKAVVNNLVGNTYGKWTVLERMENDKSGNVMWRCRCECGNEHTIASGTLSSGASRGCGQCFIDLTGERFGNWMVIQYLGKNQHGQNVWKCKCDCGNEMVRSSYQFNGKSGKCSECQVNRMIGSVYGKWLVFDKAEKNKYGQSVLWCKCTCGRTHRVPVNTLLQGKSGSCIRCSNGWKINSWSGKYPSAFYAIKPSILKRDNHKCQSPYCKAIKKKDQVLDVHHIDHNPENNTPYNLITLCHDYCHPEEQRDIEFYTDLYKTIMNERYCEG